MVLIPYKCRLETCIKYQLSPKGASLKVQLEWRCNLFFFTFDSISLMTTIFVFCLRHVSSVCRKSSFVRSLNKAKSIQRKRFFKKRFHEKKMNEVCSTTKVQRNLFRTLHTFGSLYILTVQLLDGPVWVYQLECSYCDLLKLQWNTTTFPTLRSFTWLNNPDPWWTWLSVSTRVCMLCDLLKT